MGRAANYHLKPKKGPGRKAKKQQAPVFQFKDEDGEEKKLSRRQKLRAKKRKLKNKEPEIVAPKKARNWAPESEEEDAGSDGQQLDSSEVSDEELEEQTSGKPKSTLFDDDDDDDVNGFDEMDDDDVDSYDDFDEDDDYDDDIEKLSRKLEKKKKAEDAEGDAYMEEAAGKIEIQIPTIEEVEKELSENPDLANVQSRIKDIAFILSDFSNRREEGRSRSEYLSIFLKDLTTYYSYNEFLMEKILHMFGVTELVEFLEANERPRPVTIRTNTLKTRRKLLASALIDQGVDVDVIAWSKVGLIVMQTPGSVALGATPQYLAGQYLLQGASSFLPVMALAPKNGEKVLDMCAAPGGKSTHIAAIMKNTGMIVSNDVHAARVKALVGNFHRMGITNSLITNMDGRMFAKKMPGAFDRILLDAPCSGTGVISKDESVKITKDAKDIQRCSHLQRELLLAAIDSVHKYNGENGYVVYSTCSILVEENEEVIDYALRKRKVKLVPTGLEIGKPGYIHYRGHKFDPNMHLCKRVYPHSYNMDGFFVAKLKKLDDGPRITAQEETTEETAEEMEEMEETEQKEEEAEEKEKKAKKGKKTGRALIGKKVLTGKKVLNGKKILNGKKAVNEKKAVNGKKAANEKKAVNEKEVSDEKKLVNGKKVLNGKKAVKGKKEMKEVSDEKQRVKEKNGVTGKKEVKAEKEMTGKKGIKENKEKKGKKIKKVKKLL